MRFRFPTLGIRLRLIRHKAAGLALLALFFAAPGRETCGVSITQPPPRDLTVSSPEAPLSLSPLLSWKPDFYAVAYEIEIFDALPRALAPEASDDRAVFRTSEIYTNAINLPLSAICSTTPDVPLWWRVRSLNLERQPISPFSDLAPLYTRVGVPSMAAPVICSPYDQGNGSVLLYPVYNWVRPHDASSFEIELYHENPEETLSARPIARLLSPSAELYDPEPRFGDAAYYWRVRALDDAGQPLGAWSKAGRFRTAPSDHWEIAVLGDSISHGGGHISYGPENLEYSWLHYLAFPALNLAQSGDISRDMRERFERDVVPFHPRYLLIMGGTNDLRSEDFTVDFVIENMEAIKEKCRQYGIKPIFLTLPPINPENIARAFDEPTDPRWREKFAAFNDYLRCQPHIDTARAFAAYSADGLLPQWLALDGLHQDIMGKQLIAARVNAEWAEAKKAADLWR